MECAPEQRKELLDLIAFRKNAKKDSGLSHGVAFFAFLRKMIATATTPVRPGSGT